MNEQEVIDKVCDRVVSVLYNELDYYMFEELGYTETNDKYVEDADKLIVKIIKELYQQIQFGLDAGIDGNKRT